MFLCRVRSDYLSDKLLFFMAFFIPLVSRLDIKTQSAKRFAGCVMSLVYDLDSPKERKLIRNLSREYFFALNGVAT